MPRGNSSSLPKGSSDAVIADYRYWVVYWARGEWTRGLPTHTLPRTEIDESHTLHAAYTRAIQLSPLNQVQVDLCPPPSPTHPSPPRTSPNLTRCQLISKDLCAAASKRNNFIENRQNILITFVTIVMLVHPPKTHRSLSALSYKNTQPALISVFRIAACLRSVRNGNTFQVM